VWTETHRQAKTCTWRAGASVSERYLIYAGARRDAVDPRRASTDDATARRRRRRAQAPHDSAGSETYAFQLKQPFVPLSIAGVIAPVKTMVKTQVRSGARTHRDSAGTASSAIIHHADDASARRASLITRDTRRERTSQADARR
jgi:hypothetical protein